MSKKDAFIKMVEELLDDTDLNGIDADALAYFEVIKSEKLEKPKFTDNGKLILEYMQNEHGNVDNMFKAREIAEGIFISSRSVSGSIRKLVTDGYVEKIGADPVIYSLTDLGKTVDLSKDA